MTYTYECETHGTFDVEKPISECARQEKCPKCGKEASRVWGLSNIDDTMYKRENWRKTLSTKEHAKVLMGERDPY